uniref:Uncharacterized protein n=1 Tax=Timema bartmani TaxID=61472 RepID=A0A7R9F6H8_9NEOP|nr:unnamed protein product [Timema bartmani]
MQWGLTEVDTCLIDRGSRLNEISMLRCSESAALVAACVAVTAAQLFYPEHVRTKCLATKLYGLKAADCQDLNLYSVPTYLDYGVELDFKILLDV